MQRLRSAAVSALQLSQTHVPRSVVVRSLVLVLIAVSPSCSGAPSTVGSGRVGKVSSELRLPTDESDEFRLARQSNQV